MIQDDEWNKMNDQQKLEHLYTWNTNLTSRVLSQEQEIKGLNLRVSAQGRDIETLDARLRKAEEILKANNLALTP